MDPRALCDIGAHITTGVFVGENGGSCSCCPDEALGKSDKFEKGNKEEEKEREDVMKRATEFLHKFQEK
tara:strand:+ start:250 stop:456 length:207 start_codon:yes stop_codon:yes gene_type:complete